MNYFIIMEVIKQIFLKKKSSGHGFSKFYEKHLEKNKKIKN